jgi:hypothetical protein
MRSEDIILLAGAGLLYIVVVLISAPSATSFASFFKGFNSQKHEPHFWFLVSCATISWIFASAQGIEAGNAALSVGIAFGVTANHATV